MTTTDENSIVPVVGTKVLYQMYNLL